MRRRKIIHVDMDCFYAAVEMRDDPSLRDIPLAVGGSADRRGVISTCNYIAREYGVHSAMATAYAKRLCPDLKVIPGRMSYYQEVSRQIREIFQRYTEIIEPLSLDEAFLDVTDAEHHEGSATLIAEAIRDAIREELQLTASAGIAPNKFIAKICSDENKPDGQYVVTPDEVEAFCRDLPLKKIPGVGKVTVKRLGDQGLQTCNDIRELGEQECVRRFGSLGALLFKRSQGIDNRELTTNWVRKSVSVERTFPEDINDIDGAVSAMSDLLGELQRRLEKHADRHIRNLQVKLKFADFNQTTIERRAISLDENLFQELLPLAWERGNGQGIRLLGLGVSFRDENKIAAESQLKLF
ncbi:MAG: DNA polymerase IV [Pseudomonadales bacterium]|nr:DNA polymerase IV [Pseudomonadales bacterium]MBO6595267.1 DNA polymerase IV [Pseudomonadales bacterium]MBO6701775.1 DNA polymerase IV [Pseudomonadales bacterium]MBO6821174.1 DNA polymerase IV [Pseudomonadales bacterium]MBO7007371.1 DNA polymerase IV [Pseudomonadales bacterium]